MEYRLSIMRDGEPVISIGITADEAVTAIASAMPNAREKEPEQVTEVDAKPRKYKKRAARPQSKASKDLGDEINEFHASKRQHPDTAKIEQLLIEGLTTLQIIEKVKVSAPTIGIIRARLRKEGKIT